jgi:hypothetical protein
MSLFRKEKEKSWKRKSPKIYSGVPRRDSQKKKSKLSRFLFWLLFLGFLGVCGYILLFSPFLEIESVSVEGNQNISSEEIVGKAGKTLNGKYFNFLSKRNFFLSSKKRMNQELKDNFSRLEISSIEKKFPRSILIRVKERQPELAWCSGGVCYLADKEGFVYAGANVTDSELNKNRFLIIIDDNARPVEIQHTSIGSEFVQYLKQIDTILVDELKFQIDGNYHTPAMSSREIVIKIKEGEGWLLKLSSVVSPEETKKILETIFEKELAGDKRAQLEYLDLRVKGKIYYKLK